jgi:hypothetical protein
MFQTLGCLEGRPWKAYNTIKYVDPHLSIWHMVQTHAHRQRTLICGYPMDMQSSVRDPVTTKAILEANIILNLVCYLLLRRSAFGGTNLPLGINNSRRRRRSDLGDSSYVLLLIDAGKLY